MKGLGLDWEMCIHLISMPPDLIYDDYGLFSEGNCSVKFEGETVFYSVMDFSEGSDALW